MLDVNTICKEGDIGLMIAMTLNIRFRTSSTRTSGVRMLVPSVVRKEGSTLPSSSRGPGPGSVVDFKRTYQKSVKLKTSSDADSLADPSMINKISWDWRGVQHRYWRYTKWWKFLRRSPAAVRLAWYCYCHSTDWKGFTSACRRFRVSCYCIPSLWFPCLPISTFTDCFSSSIRERNTRTCCWLGVSYCCLLLEWYPSPTD